MQVQESKDHWSLGEQLSEDNNEVTVRVLSTAAEIKLKKKDVEPTNPPQFDGVEGMAPPSPLP